MTTRTGILIGAVVLGAVLGYLGVSAFQHGFSAKEKPSQLEEWLARHARKIATPADARGLQNPYPPTLEALAEAREHWVDHCALCHGLDGSGNTMLGRNLYPPAPDLREAAVQRLSDGELYYIISNGVRFTGMPAWSSEHSPEDTWRLVLFIRRLPTLSADELEQMEEQAAAGGGDHVHAPGAAPHMHHH